jgi:hypothetical protein
MLQPRSGYNSNMFCRHDETQTSSYYNWRGEETNMAADAGNVAVITGCDGETTVIKRMTACTEKPFGLIMQEVLKAYDNAYVPWGYIRPNDLGTKKTFVGGPCAVVHMGVHDTNVYTTVSGGITAGDPLYPTASGTLSKDAGSNECATAIAIAMNTLSEALMEQGRLLRIKLLV